MTYSGGTIASQGGDSGGPYVTTVWNGAGYSYHARGTHRGHSGSTIHSIAIDAINAVGWDVA